jgi:quinol monooxygenase YgiN
MKTIYGAVFTAAMLALLGPTAKAQGPAPPQPASLAVTYLEVLPSARTEAEGLFKQLAADSRKEAGNRRYEILEQNDRNTNFVIVEDWSDAKAADAHFAGAALKQFRDKFKPITTGYFDQRPSIATVGPSETKPTAGALFAVTHVDVIPPRRDAAIAMFKKLAEDARKEPGSESFEVWYQNNRTNHFTFIEVWKDRASLDAHKAKADTIDFRDKLGAIAGALYDERLYHEID